MNTSPLSPITPDGLSISELTSRLEVFNEAYRIGAPLISDAEYDGVWVAELARRAPDSPFLSAPEPAPLLAAGSRVKLMAQMLSTDKAYSSSEVGAWVERVSVAAREAGINPAMLTVRATPKLDGVAALDLGGVVATRGKQGFGTDITRLFDRPNGIVAAERGAGSGEIVIAKDYFDRVLAPEYGLDHPRNVVAGLLAADTVKAYHQRIFDDRAIVLIPHRSLVGFDLSLAELASQWESLLTSIPALVPYLCDGVVVEVTDPALKEVMGATSHHHRWQLALKRNDEAEATVVTAVRLTTGRTGRITPTLQIAPVTQYGVTITWVSAHTCQSLIDRQLGVGAEIRVTRAGGVIPYLESVVAPAPSLGVDLGVCPSCGGSTEWDGQYLVCPNLGSCEAQASASLRHFFSTIAVCNGFGESVTDLLAASGVKRPSDLYSMNADEFVAAGISPGVARNLVNELARSLVEPISDAILLGAIGIRHLGRGDSRKLLAVYPIERVGSLTAEQVAAVPGFGPLTSGLIARSLSDRWPTISALLARGFNLIPTPLAGEQAQPVSGPLSGVVVVFTGAMSSGTRQDMEREASRLGAEVASSVSKRVTLLVCGANVGATKTDKAAALGVRVISENEYLDLAAA